MDIKPTIAMKTTTIQQLQLHPLCYRQKTAILMDSLAVKSEARAVKMIYSKVSEKNNKRVFFCLLSKTSELERMK
jgi:hypothetical protein